MFARVKVWEKERKRERISRVASARGCTRRPATLRVVDLESRQSVSWTGECARGRTRRGRARGTRTEVAATPPADDETVVAHHYYLPLSSGSAATRHRRGPDRARWPPTSRLLFVSQQLTLTITPTLLQVYVLGLGITVFYLRFYVRKLLWLGSGFYKIWGLRI